MSEDMHELAKAALERIRSNNLAIPIHATIEELEDPKMFELCLPILAHIESCYRMQEQHKKRQVDTQERLSEQLDRLRNTNHFFLA